MSSLMLYFSSRIGAAAFRMTSCGLAVAMTDSVRILRLPLLLCCSCRCGCGRRAAACGETVPEYRMLLHLIFDVHFSFLFPFLSRSFFKSVVLFNACRSSDDRIADPLDHEDDSTIMTVDEIENGIIAPCKAIHVRKVAKSACPDRSAIAV